MPRKCALLALVILCHPRTARPHEEKKEKKNNIEVYRWIVLLETRQRRRVLINIHIIYIYIYIFLLLIEYNRIYGFTQFTAVALQRYA